MSYPSRRRTDDDLPLGKLLHYSIGEDTSKIRSWDTKLVSILIDSHKRRVREKRVISLTPGDEPVSTTLFVVVLRQTILETQDNRRVLSPMYFVRLPLEAHANKHNILEMLFEQQRRDKVTRLRGMSLRNGDAPTVFCGLCDCWVSSRA